MTSDTVDTALQASARDAVRRERTAFRADDGRVLEATWFRPRSPGAGRVLIAPAMATPAAFYAAFATWLAGRGMTVLTFDYRGTTATPSELRRETADLLTWAGDAAAALEHLLDDAPAGDHTPVVWIGHSFGGQVLPFVRHDLLDSAVLVATGNGHYHHNPAWLRRRAPLLWRGIVPLTTAAAGYFPGRRLGLGDLPTRVARQWGRWCMHPEYWGADVRDIAARHALITHPVTLVSTSDDPLVMPSGPAALARALSNAPVSVVDLSPDQLSVDSIGHHGLFRRGLAHAWEAVFAPHLPHAVMATTRAQA
ncbi:alpha/beta hydrolase [Nocardioides sp. STR2]|uniref:Alpha/beta hydrolase n=1 Tax=Nocardioides pini TaxID=2975053 RepID=A0ABT4CHW7_9ACTN|nr:alpha/beta hydrolase [Nocardioides pini]MCY4728573.1 alpha/beta hydrolase [Nocardioides pini]